MRSLLILLLAFMLSSCAGPDIQHYRNAQPTLDLVQYFQGETEAWGMFQNRKGEVVKRFNVLITGTVDAQGLHLDERFRYDDGSTQQRVWHLQRGQDGIWRGTASDVEGQARGEVAGNALHWQYTLLLPVDGSTYAMQFDDWMFLIDKCSMLNRASMRKFGVEFGQVTLMFRRRACSL